MKKTKYLSILVSLYLILYAGKALSFYKPLTLAGNHSYGSIAMFSDSSIVALVAVNGSTTTAMITHHDKNGTLLQYKRLKHPQDDWINALKMIVFKDEVFVVGGLINKNDVSCGFVMRLNNCLEIIDYKAIINRKYRLQQVENIWVNDSNIIIVGKDYFRADSMITTFIFMDKSFRMRHDRSYHSYSLGELLQSSDNRIHLWGMGYYPSTYDRFVGNAKSMHLLLDEKGNFIRQIVDHKGVDSIVSAGRNLCASPDGRFFIGNYSRLGICMVNGIEVDGNHVVMKVDKDGNLLKIRQLNDSATGEYSSALCRVGDYYIAVGTYETGSWSSASIVYLIDSNLNIIRKKRMLPSLPNFSLEGSLPVNNGAILYGTQGNAVMLKLDTTLNFAASPPITYLDSLCGQTIDNSDIVMDNPDTIWLDEFPLRKNLYLSREELFAAKHIQPLLYPNPSQGTITIDFEIPESGCIKVYNVSGQLLQSEKIDQQENLNLVLSPEITGLIFVYVETEHYNYKTKVLVLRD